MLIGMQNVGSILIEKMGDAHDYILADIGTVYEQNGSIHLGSASNYFDCSLTKHRV